MNRYLLSIDQRTTGSTAMVMGMDGRTLGRESEELLLHFSAAAWVEPDPSELRAAITKAVTAGLRAARVAGSESAASGILKQRATTRSGDPFRGRPMDRARSWQARRSTEGSLCAQLAGFPSARSVPSSDGVAFVAAPTDVAAPDWELAPERRAADVLAEMPPAAGRSAKEGTQIGCIRVDGGAAQNNLLMQFQGDVFEEGSQRRCDAESAARGVALLAGVGAGVFRSVQEAA